MTVRLFTYPNCPYCVKVRAAFEEIDLEYEEVNAERGTEGSDELVELGGKQQVPFLVVEDTMMYESDEIIEYAQANLN
jgi:glutaredoxin